MPAQTIEPFQKPESSLFIGLESYTEAQSDIFYGRTEEIDRLTNLVKANTLTIVFGKSGTGKTSLLNAGVFPPLRKDYCLPFRIRLEFNNNSPDLITQIKNILISEINKYGFKVESYPASETLWEYFHNEQLWKSVTPILIFDQFEEIFTLAKKNDRFTNTELAPFWEELADLIENSIPEKLREKFLNDKENIDYSYKKQKIKILFAFREEFLPEFESITAKIPSIQYSRFRLMPMNGNQAYEVITKTWKNNIDTAQADKIVGFFSKEDGTNKAYDVMEIEPSLLSQVCSYIDKEKNIQGGAKISAEFLNKYPKEIILRSIYNEVLTESNNAVNSNKNEVEKIAKPVNEFVEDKLITDEGYRTKYALNQQDEKIKPGIEVLKSKYFLRDDGKSIELTHDVLVPVIKNDREKRRKAIAFAAARKKANRRALIIIIFSLLTAALIWYIITNKATQAKKEAIQDRKNALDSTIKLKGKIKTDSLKLAKIDSVLKIRQIQNAHQSNAGNDSVSDPLNNTYGQNKSDSDSMLIILQKQYADLKKQYADLNNRKLELDNVITDLNTKVNYHTDNQNKISSVNNALKQTVEDLKNRMYTDSMKFINQYDILRREFNAYKLKHPEPFPVVPPKPMPDVPDTNSLQLNLYYSTSKKMRIPDNLKIFLIPDSAYNKKKIKKAMIYEIRCDELDLDNAEGKRIAKYSKNGYSFSNVLPGKYFIKICAYYGGYYSITKKTIGNETTKKLDLSPPIR